MPKIQLRTALLGTMSKKFTDYMIMRVCLVVRRDLWVLLRYAKTLFHYSRSVVGLSRCDLNALSHGAPAAPSTTRWSKLIVAVITTLSL